VNNTGTKKGSIIKINGTLKRKKESVQRVLNTQYLYLLKKIYKMQHLEGSGTPVLYIGRKVLNPYPANVEYMVSS
jgi:hypothetical protein